MEGEPYIVYRRNNVNSDDIEGLSDMIVQSELYHDFRAAQEMLNNDDEAHLMYQAF